MISRYQTNEMLSIWSDTSKFNLWLDIEFEVCKAYESLGIIPIGTADELDLNINPDAIKSFEITLKHEFMAFLASLSTTENLKKYLHRGLTSSDVLDTAFAIQLRNAGNQILSRIDTLLLTLKDKALEHKYTYMMGRSHGMYAEKTTFGLVLLSFYSEWLRNKERLIQAIDEISFLQISGPVGNYSIVPIEVEKHLADKFHLKIEPVSTQIIPRDRHGLFFSIIGLMGSSIERIAVMVRNLQQSSVGEVFEGFSKGQKGSSAMPHKRNPISSENLTGIARLLRGYTIPALENIVLWHERDISHSSAERIISEDATGLCDYALKRLNELILNLDVDKERMLANIDEANELYLSQTILTKYIDDGYTRDDAYRLIQDASFKAYQENRKLSDVLNVQGIEQKIDVENIFKRFLL